MNAQGWMAPASIIAVGLTWREAIYSIILGLSITAIPLVLNGAIGAHLHVPFPVAARSSFGFLFARFAVITRMITALFWHAIQTYTGSTAMTQILRAIVPAMKPGYSKIIINDFVVPNQGAAWLQTALDWELMASLGARHRTEEEHRVLYEGVGLKMNGVWRKKGAMDAVIELELA